MKNIKSIAILVFVIMAGVGCKKEYLSIPYVDPTIPISYSTQINPIWQTSCMGSGCHNTGGIPPILTTDKSYNNLLTGGFIDPTITVPENVVLYKQLKGLDGLSEMPPSAPLSAEQMEIIKTWIIQGSKNN